VRISTARQNDLAMLGIGLFVVLVDQLTKRWILQYFLTGRPKEAIPILGPYLELRYTENTGVAFSLLEGQTIKFILIALAIAAIGYLYWRTRETGSLLLKASFGLVLGGAVGNLVDRFVRGFVVDFIHVQIPQIGFNFAVFNVADSGISIGVVLLAYLLWRSSPQEPETAAPSGERSALGTKMASLAQRAAQAAQDLRQRVGAASGANPGNDGGPQG
jgi:signal peptidase II